MNKDLEMLTKEAFGINDARKFLKYIPSVDSFRGAGIPFKDLNNIGKARAIGYHAIPALLMGGGTALKATSAERKILKEMGKRKKMFKIMARKGFDMNKELALLKLERNAVRNKAVLKALGYGTPMAGVGAGIGNLGYRYNSNMLREAFDLARRDSRGIDILQKAEDILKSKVVDSGGSINDAMRRINSVDGYRETKNFVEGNKEKLIKRFGNYQKEVNGFPLFFNLKPMSNDIVDGDNLQKIKDVAQKILNSSSQYSQKPKVTSWNPFNLKMEI